MNPRLRYRDWPGEAEGRLEWLRADLCDEVRLDFSDGAALDELEAQVLHRFDEVAALDTAEAAPFVAGVATYLGELLIRRTGARWSWPARPTAEDPPALMLTAAFDFAVVSPWDAITAAVRDRTGTAFAAFVHRCDPVEGAADPH
ncbi:hypothetical protein F5X71_21205 [Nocardia brasiliensis]|uniref:DUF3806 domain-containing protein n=1 Tax=Nocardia brasiliensis TaxID=37326 RepID=A0A6G9XUB0_NOCBR|nr:hypothetical protein [Nocardia brasiliensis]QIS04514.1 hypothetical protein F5X71_21205 [Nocardia brasiliensis]